MREKSACHACHEDVAAVTIPVSQTQGCRPKLVINRDAVNGLRGGWRQAVIAEMPG